MVTTKENCYQGLDRTVLIELKRIYDEMQKRISVEKFGEIEQKAYSKLQEMFTSTLYRPFFQGDNKFNLVNSFDKDFFIDTVSAVIEYIKFVSGSLDIDLKNLKFRLERIMEGTSVVKQEQFETEFANGRAIDVRDMPEEDYLRAVKEFSEGSEAMENFLIYCYRNKLYTKACCTGHQCKDSSRSVSYIAFDLGENDDIKEFLMSKAFENNMGIAIINFNNGLGFDLLLNPYELDKDVRFLQDCLEEYKGNEPINPVITQTLKYSRRMEKSSDEFLSICFGKLDDGKIIAEEKHKRKVISLGILDQEEYISYYKNAVREANIDATISFVARSVVNSREVARSALNYTKQFPGKFATSMKNTLSVIKRFVSRDEGREEK